MEHAQPRDTPSAVMDSIASHASLPGVQYSPGHSYVQEAVAVWGPLVARHLRRVSHGAGLDPGMWSLTVEDTVRAIVRTVYSNRGSAKKMDLKYPFDDSNVTDWLQRRTQVEISPKTGQADRHSDVKQVHGRVKALLATFRVLCPKHIMLMKKGLRCPEFDWNLGQLAAPSTEDDLSYLLYDEHRISDFIREQRHLRRTNFLLKTAPAQLDREITACTLWYLYLTFGLLRFGGLSRLHAPSPKYPASGEDSSTVLSAIAERYSALFWMPKQFAEQGRRYVAEEHGELYEALRCCKDSLNGETH